MEGLLTFIGLVLIGVWIFSRIEASSRAAVERKRATEVAMTEQRRRDLAEAERRGAARARQERLDEEDELQRMQSEDEWTRLIDGSRWEDINNPDELTPWLTSDLLKPLVRNWARLWDAGTLCVARQMADRTNVPPVQVDSMCAAALNQAIEQIRRVHPLEAHWIDWALRGHLDGQLTWCDFTGDWAWRQLIDFVKRDWTQREPEFAADPFRGM